MKCPFCGETFNKVIDSRVGKDGRVIRRRRECLQCRKRFAHGGEEGWKERAVQLRENQGRYPEGVPEEVHQHHHNR